MPKYCSVPGCRTEPDPDAGGGDGGDGDRDRRSFYKFPLQDAGRLQQWLRNMGRENWTPSRHQYICHEHFVPSCFKVRWGVRYLESDAVPTVFNTAEKRKGVSDLRDNKPKRLRADADAGVAVSDETPLASAEGLESGTDFPLTLLQAANGESAEVVVMSECPAALDAQSELVEGITAAFLTPDHSLVVRDPATDLVSLCLPDTEQFSGAETQVFAYFETIPNVFPADAVPQLCISPDTVLSSALSSQPIASTLPIVSKHVPMAPSQASLLPALDKLDTDEGEGDDGQSEDGVELQEQQLEEHCYHRSSLSREQLEAVVAELQKKVKVLQQRHRRHLDKLLGLESMVSQLRQSNLLNQERLQLLETAYVQTSAAVSDVGETVTIIYEEDDDAAYLYTPLNPAAETV